MNKDRIQGSVEQAKGNVKEVAGKVTGDAKLETEGKTQRTARFRMRSAASRTRSRKPSTISGHHLHNVRSPQLAASFISNQACDVGNDAVDGSSTGT
jgi:hypothetical protein